MTLRELIKFLESYPQDLVVKFGIGTPHSYRGYYNCLAFEVMFEIPISEMLTVAKVCVNMIFQGYKGGNYMMGLDTEVYLSHYGCWRSDDTPLSENTLRQLFAVV